MAIKHHESGETFVYDITKFLAVHPGGPKVPLMVAGDDATEVFYDMHKKDVIDKHGEKFIIGKLVAKARL